MTDYADRLYDHPQKKIELISLMKLIGGETYAETAAIINRLEENGILKRVKKSGTNGMKPPLFMRYNIIRQDKAKDNSDIMAEIKSLHHRIYTEPFLKNPEKYIKSKKLILPLSEYMKLHSDELISVMSENERAYSIWHDEKILDKDENVRLLKECRVFDALNTYPTPEPFFDYRTETAPSCVLVIENKDTWFSLRKIMIENKVSIKISDITVDCVLYGEGKKISQTMSSLSEYLALDDFHGKVYYWGDIDYEGIGIYRMTAQKNPDLNITPFVPIYEKMLDEFQILAANSDSNEHFKCRSDQKALKDMNFFFSYFNEKTIDRIKFLLESGLYIPQEIVNYPLLRKLCGKD